MVDQTSLTLHEQGVKALEDLKNPFGYIDSKLFAQVLGAMADLQLYNERLARNSIEQWGIGTIRTFMDSLEEMGCAMGGEYDDPPDNVKFTVNELKTALHCTLGDLLDEKLGLDQSKLGKLPLGTCYCAVCENEQGNRRANSIGETIPDPWKSEKLWHDRADRAGCKLVPGFYVWNQITGERRFVGRLTFETTLNEAEKLACEALLARQSNLIDELNADRLEVVSPGRMR